MPFIAKIPVVTLTAGRRITIEAGQALPDDMHPHDIKELLTMAAIGDSETDASLALAAAGRQIHHATQEFNAAKARVIAARASTEPPPVATAPATEQGSNQPSASATAPATEAITTTATGATTSAPTESGTGPATEAAAPAAKKNGNRKPATGQPPINVTPTA